MKLLTTLHTRTVGYVGLAFGAVSIVAAVGAFFHLLSDPHYLVNLAVAANDLRFHRADANDHFVIAQLAGAFIAIIGAVVVALLGTYLGLSHFAEDPKT